jgi:hypothetical protein
VPGRPAAEVVGQQLLVVSPPSMVQPRALSTVVDSVSVLLAGAGSGWVAETVAFAVTVPVVHDPWDGVAELIVADAPLRVVDSVTPVAVLGPALAAVAV